VSDRPIEELIGWTERPWIGDWIVNIRTQPYEVRTHATDDDLAAWLEGAGYVVGLNRINGQTSACVAKRTDIGWSEFDCTDYLPTILAALTAAVRKVAGDE
jgi:hypothetical protein